MNRLQLKRKVTEILGNEDLLSVIRGLRRFDPRALINPLFSCLCHSSETVRWHAVSGFGLTVQSIAHQELEDARVIMRRFLWMLNDESGGIGWGVPEALAEVMFFQEILAREYLHMLVSYTRDDGPELFQDGNFMELPQLQEGVLWGLCRVAEKYQKWLRASQVDENMEYYFSSKSPQVRGLVCRFCGLIDFQDFRIHIDQLIKDDHAIRIYHDGLFQDTTVGRLASEAIETMDGKGPREVV